VRGEVKKEDIERVGFIGAEVIGDFPDEYTIEEKCFSADRGNEEMLDFWAFRRESDS
jgi:hypothetical protein